MKLDKKYIRKLILEAMHDRGFPELDSEGMEPSPDESDPRSLPNTFTDSYETTEADVEAIEEPPIEDMEEQSWGTEYNMEKDGGLRAMKKMIKSNAGYRVRQFIDLGQSEERIRYAAKVAMDEIFAESSDS
mgnify:CR=1 FL=1|tara:strand:+ start:473 stop:865 length:393 start_codon:yes stop_codon:yes gene_type:complete